MRRPLPITAPATIWFLVASLAVPPALAQGPAIALSPVATPYGLSDPAPVRAIFDSLITVALGKAGYRVVPASEAGALWRRLVDSVQGFYDPITGEIVEAKYRAVHDGVLRQLVARFGVQLWLRPSIEILHVDFEGGKVVWDETSERVGGSGGSLPAFSLVVAVEDSAGVETASGRGGIQLAAKEPGKPVAREKLFRDDDRNRKAVERALAPLLSGRPRP